jgi:hypothetical protein
VGGLRLLPWEEGFVERAVDAAADGWPSEIPYGRRSEGTRFQQAVYRLGRVRGVLVRTRKRPGRRRGGVLEVLPPRSFDTVPKP